MSVGEFLAWLAPLCLASLPASSRKRIPVLSSVILAAVLSLVERLETRLLAPEGHSPGVPTVPQHSGDGSRERECARLQKQVARLLAKSKVTKKQPSRIANGSYHLMRQWTIHLLPPAPLAISDAVRLCQYGSGNIGRQYEK
jgi:hypothetical protein